MAPGSKADRPGNPQTIVITYPVRGGITTDLSPFEAEILSSENFIPGIGGADLLTVRPGIEPFDEVDPGTDNGRMSLVVGSLGAENADAASYVVLMGVPQDGSGIKNMWTVPQVQGGLVGDIDIPTPPLDRVALFASVTSRNDGITPGDPQFTILALYSAYYDAAIYFYLRVAGSVLTTTNNVRVWASQDNSRFLATVPGPTGGLPNKLVSFARADLLTQGGAMVDPPDPVVLADLPYNDPDTTYDFSSSLYLSDWVEDADQNCWMSKGGVFYIACSAADRSKVEVLRFNASTGAFLSALDSITLASTNYHFVGWSPPDADGYHLAFVYYRNSPTTTVTLHKLDPSTGASLYDTTITLGNTQVNYVQAVPLESGGFALHMYTTEDVVYYVEDTGSALNANLINPTGFTNADVNRGAMLTLLGGAGDIVYFSAEDFNTSDRYLYAIADWAGTPTVTKSDATPLATAAANGWEYDQDYVNSHFVSMVSTYSRIDATTAVFGLTGKISLELGTLGDAVGNLPQVDSLGLNDYDNKCVGGSAYTGTFTYPAPDCFGWLQNACGTRETI